MPKCAHARAAFPHTASERPRHLAVAALLLVIPFLALGPRAGAKDPAARPPAIELYVSEGVPELPLDLRDPALLTPLDPQTVSNQPDRPTVTLDAGTEFASAVLSADGSTLASVHGSEIMVRDGLFGSERSRFMPAGSVAALTLSADGTRLVASLYDDYADATFTPGWKVFDTGDGRLLATIHGSDGPEQHQIDTAASRLYRLIAVGAGPDPVNETGPRSARLVVHDLASGEEVGRLELPEVLAGFWQTDQAAAWGEAVTALLQPGVALSPDGHRLAIVHADEETLTVIDAERLEVEHTVSLARPHRWLDRVLEFVPLMPQRASAKAMEGTMLQAVFTPDGGHLYVFGYEADMDGDRPTFDGLGLRLIDVEAGEVVARALPHVQIDRVIPTPDGRSIYVAAMDQTTSGETMPFLLRRLDAPTLEIRAKREFADYRSFLIRPALARPDAPVTLEMVDHAFTPGALEIPANAEIEVRVVNHGTESHNVTAGDERRTVIDIDLAPGESRTATINAPVGESKLFCDVAGHIEAGMGGILFVG